MDDKVVTIKGKKKVVKCRGIDIHGNPCRANDKENGFCQNHDYMKDYTDEMMANLTPCSGCKRQMYLPNGGTCDDDKKRAKEAREKKKQTNVKCKKDDCNFKSKENGYCGNHHLQAWKDEVEKSGNKVCVNYIRACRNILEGDSTNSRCQNCRTGANEATKTNKAKIIEQNELNNGILCTKCLDSFPEEHFIGDKGQITKTCKHCRDINKVADLKRVNRERNYTEELKNNPERAAKKAQWKIDNYEKVARYWMDSRARKIKTLGVELYLKKNAEYAKTFRQANEELMKEIYAKQKLNGKSKAVAYKYRAEKYGIDFTLTLDDCEEMFNSKCYYCAQDVTELSLNGIDRVSNDEGYTQTNSVPCCHMCNFMKGCLDIDTFTGMCNHILTYNKIVDGKLNYNLFGDNYSVSYDTYFQRATKKNLSFELTNEDYIKLINDVCYLCGKSNSSTHVNGIDRFNNDIGYNITNCRTCCANCNYMKRENDYDDYINKLLKIYDNHKETLFVDKFYNIINSNKNIIDAQINNISIKPNTEKVNKEKCENDNNGKIQYKNTKIMVINKNKKSDEQIKEVARIKKQKQRIALREKYGDDEYLQRRALEVKEYRQKVKNNKLDEANLPETKDKDVQ
jgi:hypothetical protein